MRAIMAEQGQLRKMIRATTKVVVWLLRCPKRIWTANHARMWAWHIAVIFLALSLLGGLGSCVVVPILRPETPTVLADFSEFANYYNPKFRADVRYPILDSDLWHFIMPGDTVILRLDTGKVKSVDGRYYLRNLKVSRLPTHDIKGATIDYGPAPVIANAADLAKPWKEISFFHPIDNMFPRVPVFGFTPRLQLVVPVDDALWGEFFSVQISAEVVFAEKAGDLPTSPLYVTMYTDVEETFTFRIVPKSFLEAEEQYADVVDERYARFRLFRSFKKWSMVTMIASFVLFIGLALYSPAL